MDVKAVNDEQATATRRFLVVAGSLVILLGHSRVTLAIWGWYQAKRDMLKVWRNQTPIPVVIKRCWQNGPRGGQGGGSGRGYDPSGCN